jgi:hypothetical protein
MIHHYLHRGSGTVTLSELLNADEVTKHFLKVSMVLYYEEESKRGGAN